MLRAGRVADEIEGEPAVFCHPRGRDAGLLGFREQPQRLDRAARPRIGLGHAELGAGIAGGQFVGATEKPDRGIDVTQFERCLAGIEQGIDIGRIDRQPTQRFAEDPLTGIWQGLNDFALRQRRPGMGSQTKHCRDGGQTTCGSHASGVTVRALTRTENTAITGCSGVRGSAGY